MKHLIGTGGWSYFRIPQKTSLKAYSEHFDYVEVNSTFYKYPSMQIVERWRRTVPSNFTFTVRCHQDLTHTVGLKPVDEAHSVLSQMVNVCRVLDAPFLHLLTPSTYVFDGPTIDDARDFLSSVSLKGVRLAWEARSQTTEKFGDLMRDLNIVHSVDFSKEQADVPSDTVYTRLFGKGKHNIYQFTDDELAEVEEKILKVEARTAIVSFHGVRMSSDALRFKKFRETGKFLPVTAYTGINSARAVLEEDAEFPSTKEELVEHQGWKVIDLTDDKRVHMSELLSRLPDRTYSGLDEVIRELANLQ